MKIFVAASYSSKVDYTAGEVLSDYKVWLENLLDQLEGYGEVLLPLKSDPFTK